MKVSICTPVHGDPKAGYTRSLAAMLLATASLPRAGAFEKLRLSYTLASGHLLPTRDHLAKAALAAGADKILWIDADQTFPPDTLIRLLARNLRIVGANYVRRGGGGGGPLATSLAGAPVFTTAEKARAQEVEEVAGLGLGLVLMDAPSSARSPGPGSTPAGARTARSAPKTISSSPGFARPAFPSMSITASPGRSATSPKKC
jgi:hypothetical protein